MNYNDIRKNENKGFSLVELIVVIAIMAVMTAVLAPALLSYVERSRAQKDDSAMAEVANAFQLALADQDVYDEVMMFTCYGNVSCYIDSTMDAETDAAKKPTKIITKTAANKVGETAKKDQYYFADDARIADEEPYFVTGNMRGVTITFLPDSTGNNNFFDLKDAQVNYFVEGGAGNKYMSEKRATHGEVDTFAPITSKAKADITNVEIDDMSGARLKADGTAGDGKAYLFNSVRATVGETIQLDSQTYRNSSYTVFIRMGTTGIDASTSSGISVYGQWNGTNLDNSMLDKTAAELDNDVVSGG